MTVHREGCGGGEAIVVKARMALDYDRLRLVDASYQAFIASATSASDTLR